MCKNLEGEIADVGFGTGFSEQFHHLVWSDGVNGLGI